MNELISTTQNQNGEITISGRELHEFLEVRTAYKDWFPRMIAYGFEDGMDFSSILSESSGGRPAQDHQIKLDMAKEIAMIQRSEKGKQARQYFLHLEKMWNSPEMVIKRAMDFQQQKIVQLETQIRSEKKYTDFGKVVEMSDAAISIGAFVKIVYDKHGINIGRNRMFEWLREKGYLIKNGREKNNPKQHYLDQGLFELRPTIVKRTEGDVQTNTTLVTGKGQVRLTETLLKEFSKQKAI